MSAYLNRISTALPPNDVHDTFLAFAHQLLDGSRTQALFDRAAQRCQIEQRWSVLAPAPGESGDCVDDAGFYRLGGFPTTGERMRVYERFAPDLAARAAEGLDLGDEAGRITHVVVASCTGLIAPGLDLQLVARLGLNPSVERTVIGFMGCYAAINALKLARHVVRSEPAARVLIVCLELCTLHLHETAALEEVLSFMVFGDGAAAALVSADPTGLSLDRFHAVLAPEASDQIVWSIGDQGFDMVLSGRVPGSVGAAMRGRRDEVLDGASVAEIAHWAVHPGGRSVLDAVESALELDPAALSVSREVLRRHGNMSSATILFVLKAMMADVGAGERGCAMAFGPGLTAETLLFERNGAVTQDFSRRSVQAELMDTEPVGFEVFRDCLRDLAKVNVLTLAKGPTLGFLEALRREGRLDLGRPVQIVDVGSGYGDMLRAIDRWGVRRGVDLRLTGVDLNPWSARAASEATGAGRPIRWLTSDIFDYDGSPDLVVSSLFTHHLDDRQLPRFLAWMEEASRIGWHVNDLHRHPLPFHLFTWLSALMRWHRFVRHDGPVSIARAFTRADWRRVLAEAQIREAAVDIRWRFPFRLCLSRVRGAA